jgi:hypothetical protein
VSPQPLRKPQAEYAIRTTITPAMATKYLELNQLPNRHLKEAHIHRLANDMYDGRWRCNGESIIFDTDGNILDGQHRLHAIVRSKTAIDTYIVHGMDPEVMSTLDRGSLRSMADILGMQGEINRTQLAAALSWLWSYEHGGLQTYHNPVLKPTSGQMEDTLRRHPGIRASCPHAKHSALLLIVGLGTALHYLFAKKDAHGADTFFATLGHGEQLSKTDGLYQLRERLSKNRMERRKLPAVDIAALTIKAWNAHRTGTKVRLLRWRGGSDKGREGNTPEEFPAIL